MIIHQPEILYQDEHTIVWSKIELRRKQENFPDYLWFRIPDQFAEFIGLNSDAFLVPGLLAAMHLGEDLQVRGVVSPRLAYNLYEYQYVMNFWMPKDVRPVGIQYEQLAPEKSTPQAVGCTFSSGVDSWFTIWNHIPKNQPIQDYRLTHALFINRFDITRKEPKKFQRLFEPCQRQLQHLGIELIPLETNLVSTIIPRLPIAVYFSPILAGSAMILGGLFKRFIIASGREYQRLLEKPSSSHPLTERLLSTDTLELIHYGTMYRRHEKIEAIRHWQPVQENLRVCGMPGLDENKLNCSRCEKCMRTIVPIYALGVMEEFTTFTRPFRTNRDTIWLARKFRPTQVSLPDLYLFIHKHKPDMLPWLRVAVLLGYIRYNILKRIPETVKKSLQRFGYYIDPFMEKNAFENLDIIQLIRTNDQV